jgi:hypothetical protein
LTSKQHPQILWRDKLRDKRIGNRISYADSYNILEGTELFCPARHLKISGNDLLS